MSNATPPQPEVASGPGWVRWAPVLIVLAAWIAHAGARQGTWVLDDVRLVRDNALVARGPAAVPHVFAKRDTDEMTARYGPLTVASFAFEAPLWRQSDGSLAPGGFHLTNLLLHGLSALLLFRFLLGLLPRRPGVAFAAALLFAVHPLHAGTVATLMGRRELLGVLFSLLTALAWRAWGGRRVAWVPVAALAWLVALQASPLVIGLPLVLWILDRARPPAGEEPPARAAGAYVLVFAAPLAVFLATWSGIPVLDLDLPIQPALERVGVGFEGLARAALALLIPIGLRGDHSDEAVPLVGFEASPVGVVCAALACVLAVVAIVRALRGRAGLFSTAWLATLALAVPAFLVQPAGAALEGPFAYVVALPLFVAAGGIALALFRVAASSKASSSFVMARGALVAALAVIALVGLTHREALGWRDDEAFHERLLDRNPRHVRAMVRLVRAQRRIADELRARATTLPATSPERKAALKLRLEALEASAAWGRRAVKHELGRRSAEAWREVGYTRLERDLTAGALRALMTARTLDPFFQQPLDRQVGASSERRRTLAAELYFAMARCHEALGEGEKAADAYHAASRLEPDNLTYMRRAGASLCRVGRYAEGLRLLVTVRRRTQDPEQRKQLDTIIAGARRSARTLATRLVAEGESKQADGDMRAAVKLYERAIAMNPAYARAFIRAGWLRGMWFGGYEIAEAHFREAEKLLREAGVPDTDLDLRQLRDFRHELEKQKAEEEREEGK